MWLVTIWVSFGNAATEHRWLIMCGLGVCTAVGYAVRPAGAIVWLAVPVVIAAQTCSLRSTLLLLVGSCAGMAAALILISYARGESLYLTTYAFPREMRCCDPMSYAARAAHAFVRNVQSGILESYGIVVLTPFLILRAHAQSVSREALVWYACWLVAAVSASLVVACYPIYQPAFVVTRYTTPFLIPVVLSSVTLLSTVRVNIAWLVTGISSVAVAGWYIPAREARLIDNISVAWWQCDAIPCSTSMAVLGAALLSLCVVRASMVRVTAFCVCIAVIAIMNGMVLWRSSAHNKRHLARLCAAMPAHVQPGATYTPMLGDRNKIHIFDYTVLQLWYPAVKILPPSPWARPTALPCDMARCRLMSFPNTRRNKQ